ncbi:hypothetical protein [Bordetella petrii]|uniref:hypothetical protein n=1 Tax=Bordetella petrii TaxID=94624 RepID=UPI001A963D88|nr:hypothetical protein [Bordetella petrii]MBO1111816.1 hypothetical protein [Bordetella petrii]
MIYYHLTGLLGYVLIIGSAACFLVYVALLVSITGFFGNEHAYNIILACFFAGIMLFQLRSLLVDFISEHVFKSGTRVAGKILAAENCGRQGGDNDRWYQLVVELEPSQATLSGRDVYIEQLFKERAAEWLKQGAQVPVRYSPRMRLAIIDHEDAYQRLHAGPQFSLRRR